jgi:ABC-type antimicrobial peptide transport system permease subunit
MGIAVLAGTGFTRADESGDSFVAAVSATTAGRLWPNQSAIGKHIRFVGDEDWRTVVGVITDVRAYDLQKNVPDFFTGGTVYVPYSPKATLEDGRVPAEMTIAVQTASGDSETAATLRGIVTGLSPEVPVSELKSMRTVVSEAVSTPASTASLIAAFAGLALVLGLIGIYGVLSFLVSKRTREIGIRIALGARRHHVLYLVLREGVKVSLLGIGLGLAGAFVVTRWLASELYGVGPMDPLTYAGVAAAMAAATLFACYVPARRALRVDPLIALRYE